MIRNERSLLYYYTSQVENKRAGMYSEHYFGTGNNSDKEKLQKMDNKELFKLICTMKQPTNLGAGASVSLQLIQVE